VSTSTISVNLFCWHQHR